MPIEFHCPKCGKTVRAPDDAGGRRGKCPSCHQTIYIPTPDDQLEPLELSPIDPEDEKRQKELETEASALRAAALLDADAGDSDSPSSPPADFDVEQYVVRFAICMSQGRLDEAEECAVMLRQRQDRTNEVVDRLMGDELPPNGLESVPRPVLNGFLKQLRK